MIELTKALESLTPSGLNDLGGAWDSQVSVALGELLTSAPTDVNLTTDNAWALLSWVEGMASLIARTHDGNLVDRAIFALCVIDSAARIDTREILLIGSVLRRGSVIGGVDFPAAVERVAKLVGRSPLLSELRLVSAQLPRSHEEVVGNHGIELRRVPNVVDFADLMKKLGE